MPKASINEQVENILGMINSGNFDAQALIKLYNNARSNNEVTDKQREDIVEAIEYQLWVTSPGKAKKVFGARNRDTSEKLQLFLNELKTRLDLSKNQHKTKVKIGGNVIRGDALVYDYISYRDIENNMIAHLAFRKIGEEDALEIAVRKHHLKDLHTSKDQETVFPEHAFDEACDLYERYLSEILLAV